MTSHSLFGFVTSLLWCAYLSGAITGYGTLLLAAFRSRRPPLPLAATVGFPALLFLGGLLNLAHAFTRPILAAVTILGWLALLLLRVARPGLASAARAPRMLLLAVSLVFLARVAATPHWSFYQRSDDYNFYLAEPLKSLQTHHLAPDPFSERRIISSLGGNYFLQDLVLVALPLENVQMADRTLGLFLLGLLAFALASEFCLTPRQRAVFALLVLSVPQLCFNLTFVILPSALFFGLVYLAVQRSHLANRRTLLAFLPGALAGAIATMKSTYLPHGVFFCIFLAICSGYRKRLVAGMLSGLLATLKSALTAALACLLLMFPWMLASHAASGTWFYPSLGYGFHYPAYHLFPAPGGAASDAFVRKVLPFCAPLLALLLAAFALRVPEERTDAILSLMAAVSLAALLVGTATGGDSLRRYNYPAVVPAILLLFIVASRRLNSSPNDVTSRIFQTVSVLLGAGTSLMIGLNSLTHEYRQVAVGLKQSLTPFHIVPPSAVAEYTAMQAAIPPPTGSDGAVLATAQYAFLLNFQAHAIDIADFSGAAGPPPGWPLRQDGEALARYLRACHIRYLLFSYSDWAYDDSVASQIIHDPAHHTRTVRLETEITALAHHQYAQLARTHRKLYDDGRNYVLDLSQPAAD